MDVPGEKIQERKGVDMTPSDSRTVMGHCAAKPKLPVHFKVCRKKQTEIQLFKDL